jgi:hypothetical protein
VVERLQNMPAGTLGFRLSGKINRDEYFEILDPVREKLERGEKVSFLVETAPDFQGLDLVGLKHRSAWDRLAVVTDKDWIRHGVAAFAWVIPGEIRVFEPGELEKAKAWTGAAEV